MKTQLAPRATLTPDLVETSMAKEKEDDEERRNKQYYCKVNNKEALKRLKKITKDIFSCVEA